MSYSAPRLVVQSALVAILAVPAILHAQETTSEIPSMTIRANTRLVFVDVVVTDKKGQPITGLKADDFTLEENGKKQKVSVFVPPGATNGAQRGPVPPGIFSNRPEHVGPAGIPTVLLLDAANSPFKDQAYGRLQMLKYVVEQGQGGHPMAVLTLTDQLRVLQQFTSDPAVLVTAIKNLTPQEPILQPGAPPPESHSISTGNLRNGGATSSVIATAAARQFADIAIGYNLERRTLITVQAMKALSRILGGLPGRKNVVWLTANFPFDLIPENRDISDEELATALPHMGSQAVSVRSAGAAAAEQRQLYGQEIKEAESQLATANVAIYPVDLRGIMASGIDVSTTGTMEEVAAETGGKAYTNQNEIKLGIDLAVSDEKASYALGYYPENKKWDGKFRSLKVKVAQRDTELRYRTGFFAIDHGPTKNTNFEQDVAAALEVEAPATQVSFMAQAKSTDPGKMRVVFLVDAHTLSAEDASGGKRINVILYASVYNSSGKNMETRSTKVDHSFDAATYQQVLDKGMMVPLDMEMPAGGQQLRLAVLDNKTGFIGTANGPLGQ
jgi:VWFA-related protein